MYDDAIAGALAYEGATDSTTTVGLVAGVDQKV